MTTSKIDKDYVFDYLVNNHNGIYRPNTGWIEIPCPYCDKNSDKRHFNINKDEGNFYFRCFRASCLASGPLTGVEAIHIGIKDKNIIDYIENEYLANRGKTFKTKYHRNEKMEVERDNPSKICCDYFYNRVKVDLLEVMEEYRIFTNLKLFYKRNQDKIDYYLLKYFIKEHRDKHYLYFINDTYTLILYRQCDGDDKGQISLVRKKNMTHKPYSLEVPKKKIDGTNTLYVSEGPFDIINIKLHKTKNKEGIYVALGGLAKLYKILKEFSKIYYFPDIIIFSDSDVLVGHYKRVIRYIKKYIGRLYVVYNKAGKDYGEDYTKWDLEELLIYDNLERSIYD